MLHGRYVIELKIGDSMQNRKELASRDGFSIIEVSETDENGKVIITAYEVYGPNGE